jgi:hypothetical protein
MQQDKYVFLMALVRPHAKNAHIYLIFVPLSAQADFLRIIPQWCAPADMSPS